MSLIALTSIHTVDIQIEMTSRGSGMGTIRAWGDGTTVGNNVRSSMLCRVRPMQSRDMQADKDSMRATYRVVFHENPNVTEKHRILWDDSDGQQHILLVRRIQNAHALDRFWIAECEEARDIDNV